MMLEFLEIAKYMKYHKLSVVMVASTTKRCYVSTRNHKIAVTFIVSPATWKVGRIDLI